MHVVIAALGGSLDAHSYIVHIGEDYITATRHAMAEELRTEKSGSPYLCYVLEDTHTCTPSSMVEDTLVENGITQEDVRNYNPRVNYWGAVGEKAG